MVKAEYEGYKICPTWDVVIACEEELSQLGDEKVRISLGFKGFVRNYPGKKRKKVSQRDYNMIR